MAKEALRAERKDDAAKEKARRKGGAEGEEEGRRPTMEAWAT